MWNAVELDLLPGRVRAVSAPDHRQALVVITTEGLYGVWFTRRATALRLGGVADAERAFDPATGVLTWQGVPFALHGDVAGKRHGGGLPGSTPQGDALAFEAGRPVGIDAAGGARAAIEEPPRAGKWFAAGFSPDGRYLLVADEWSVRLFRYEPPKGGTPARKPSGEQAALLRAVAAEPDDDAARLVYADWLADHDQPERGEFIRLQCKHARRLRAGEPFAGGEREQELLARHGDFWQAECPALRGVKWSGFWRGFPGVTVTSATTLAKSAAAIWGAAPVESVVVEKFDARGAAALAKCPQLARLRVLEVKSYHSPAEGDEPLRPLLSCPALAGLWCLAFTGNAHLSEPAVELLADSPALRNLEFLTLRRCGVTDGGARALAASPHLPRLRELDLTGNEFTGGVPTVLRKRFPGVRL